MVYGMIAELGNGGVAVLRRSACTDRLMSGAAGNAICGGDGADTISRRQL